MCKIPIKNQEQNCVTHHNTLCRFDGSGILEKRTDHSSSVFAFSQSQILRHCLQMAMAPPPLSPPQLPRKASMYFENCPSSSIQLCTRETSVIHILGTTTMDQKTLESSKCYLDSSRSFGRGKKKRKKGWVHFFFFRFLCFSGNPYKCLYKTYRMHIICFCFSHFPHFAQILKIAALVLEHHL